MAMYHVTVMIHQVTHYVLNMPTLHLVVNTKLSNKHPEVPIYQIKLSRINLLSDHK